MNTLLTALIVLAATFGFCFSRHGGPISRAQGEASDAAARPQDSLRSGPQHQMLQKLAGTWDAVIIARDATGGEQKSKGTLTRQAHADFHIIDSFQGEFMGMKFDGHGMNGYCAVRKQYFTFWTDSMTASPMTLHGDYDLTKRELALSGECYGMSGKLEPCRTVTRFRDDDHFTWAMFGPGPDGNEVQHLAIEYTRKR